MFDEFLNDMGVNKFIYVNTEPKNCDKYHQEWINSMEIKNL